MDKVRKLFFERVCLGANLVGIVFLAGVALVLVGEIVSRTLFRAPIPGSWEIVDSMMAVLATVGFAFGLYQGKHIRATVVTELLPPKVQSGVLLLAYLLGFAVNVILFWHLVISAASSVAVREVTSGKIGVPVYLPKSVFAFAVLLFCFAWLFYIVDEVRRLLK